jgi:hypothetical protein
VSYRLATAAVGAVYVAASLPMGGFAVWAATDSYGDRHSSDGVTRAQFPFSILVLAASVAVVLLVLGSGVAARRRWSGGRALWFLAAVAALPPLLLASSAVVGWLHGPLLSVLAVVGLVTAAAVVIAFRSPAWPWPEPSAPAAGDGS